MMSDIYQIDQDNRQYKQNKKIAIFRFVSLETDPKAILDL